MILSGIHQTRNRRSRMGFTLEEVIMSLAIAFISIGVMVSTHILSFQTAEWTGYNLAAESLASQRMEQTRAARWNLQAYPQIDEVVESNFPAIVRALDVPIHGTNITTATVSTSIQDVSSNPPLKQIRVDVVWSYLERGPFTNSVIAYRSPDQ